MADDDNSFWESVGQILAVAGAAYAVSQKYGGQEKQTSGANLITQKQPFPSKIYHIGDWSRSSGAYALWRAKGNEFFVVKMINEGRVDGYNGFWLHDDKVTINSGGEITAVTKGGASVGDNRYRDDSTQPSRVILKTRLGLPTETAYSDLVSALPSEWTNNHKGNGIASVYMRVFAPGAKWFRQAFPNGLPELSVATRGVCFDWRDGTQSRASPSTWKWSANPVVWLTHLEWFLWGMDWDRQIEPVLDQLTDEADACDEAVSLKAGGTEKRYRCAFNYNAAEKTTEEVRQILLDSMAGTYGKDLRGRLVIRPGVWREPEVTIERKFIRGFTFSRGQEAEDQIREYAITVKSAADDYLDLPLAPFRIGTGGRSEALNLEGVYSQAQGQRIAKIKLGRQRFKPESVDFTDYGLSVWGERNVALDIPDFPEFENFVVEPIQPELTDMAANVSMGYRRIVPDIFAWNAATEEADLITPIVRPDLAGLSAPDIDSITVVGTAELPQLQIVATGPNRADLTWVMYWREVGATTWISQSFSSPQQLGGGQVRFTSPVIQTSNDIEVEVEFQTASGTPSPRSATETVNTSVTPVTLAAPTGLGSTKPGPGSIVIQVTASASAEAQFTNIWRNTTNNFSTATLIARQVTVPSQAISIGDPNNPTWTTPGISLYYWATAETGAGATSLPTAVLPVTT